MKKTDSKHKIENYEINDYRYSSFWEGREYEDKAERIAIEHLIRSAKDGWFIDLGGAFGRLLDSYKDVYEHVIILDYATNEFYIAKEKADELKIKIDLVAANAYHLPFKDNTLDGGISIRVMHHLDKPEDFFKELYRVLKPGSVFILEFANKNNLKSVIKHALKLDFGFFTKESYKLPHRNDSQGGAESDQETLIWDHSFRKIKQGVLRNGFKIKRVMGVSWYRHRLFKKYVPKKLLYLLERTSQILWSWTKLSPSVFLMLEKPAPNRELQLKKADKIDNILVDPESNTSINSANKSKYFQKDKAGTEFWDLRFPRP